MSTAIASDPKKKLPRKIVDYFIDLGFDDTTIFQTKGSFPKGTFGFLIKTNAAKNLKGGGGPRCNKVCNAIFIYVFLSLGIFLRMVLNLPNLKVNISAITVANLSGSFVLGIIILAPVIRYMNKKISGKKLTLMHLGVAVFIGYTLDTALSLGIDKLFPAMS
jgi:hypothetical protein